MKHLSEAILLEAAQNILQLDNNVKGSHCWTCMATLNSCMLWTAAGDSDAQREGVVTFGSTLNKIFVVIDINKCSSTIHRTHYCVSMATTVTRTHRDVALHVNCPSCYTVDILHSLDQYLTMFLLSRTPKEI
jgi:hypothetical protein